MSSNGIGKSTYRAFLNGFARFFGSKNAKLFDARFRYGRRLDIEKPRTLADKISWIELNADEELMARCTDKYALRDYVANLGAENILIPLCGGPWSSVEEIDISAFPDKFVLKATHGCEMNYICMDRTRLDVDDMISHAHQWLAADYPRACVEPHYKLIPRRIYAEEYVGGLDDVIDYKFHCLNGVPSFVLTCSNREESLKLNLYDLEWKPIEGLRGSMKNEREIPKPSGFDTMLEIAKSLSADFDFVRVDLYEAEGKVYFGELTFSPAGGVLPYFTDDFIFRWGEVLHVRGMRESRSHKPFDDAADRGEIR